MLPCAELMLTDIEFVLTRMDEIVETCRKQVLVQGYFAAMYRRVTRAIKDGIEQGAFIDGPRMSRFDRVFAEHYFQAFDAHRRGQLEAVPAAWRLALDRAQSKRGLIVQHLVLGMNAHIYLDLGIAAATLMAGQNYEALHADFETINRILLQQLKPTELKLGELSPAVAFLDRFLGSLDERLSRLALETFRESAWEFGRRLAHASADEQRVLIATRDAQVTLLAELVVPTHGVWKYVTHAGQLLESRNVLHNIDVLS
jgi:hypothetical protein